MRGDRLFKRSLRLTYGTQDDPGAFAPIKPFNLSHSDDGEEGLRVRFNASRNNRGQADRCKLQIYNMPKDLMKSMREDLQDQWRYRREIQNTETDSLERARKLKLVADGFRVNLFVGYGSSELLLFRGDLMKVTSKPPRGSPDTILEIELGDTLLALRDSYMRPFWGVGATWQNIIEASAAAAAVKIDKASKLIISGVAPNATITKLKNGYGARGRVGDTLEELIDLFGLQWWVRDGVLYFVPQGGTLADFSIVLRQGLDLLDFTEPSDYGDIKGRALLNPNIVPGRGLILKDPLGNNLDPLGFRVNTVQYQGDTHGNAWYASFQATTVDTSLLTETREFTDAQVGNVVADQLVGGGN